MPKIMLDEFHLRLFVPDRMAPTESRAIRKVINSKRFHAGLVRTLRTFLGRYRSLSKVRVKVAA